MITSGIGKWIVRLLLAAIVLVSVVICWICFISPMTYARQKQGFDLADPAPFQMQIEATQTQSYTVGLEYYFDEADKVAREKLWQAVGGGRQVAPGRWDEPGAPFDVRITLANRQSGKPVVATYIVHPKLSAWGSGALRSEILVTPLEKGTYSLTVPRVGPATNLSDAQVSVSFGKTWYK